jgi:hypothetical protein
VRAQRRGTGAAQTHPGPVERQPGSGLVVTAARQGDREQRMQGGVEQRGVDFEA